MQDNWLTVLPAGVEGKDLEIYSLLGALALAATLAACATRSTGGKQKHPQAGKRVSEPKLLRRVEGITGRLVAQPVKMRPDSAQWDRSVPVIDDPKTVNAWCIAGGRMALCTDR
jgi:hypothetical protein